MPRKPACQTKRPPPQVFNGISGWSFHRQALSIGRKTELSLLRVFAELLELHFHKCCLPFGFGVTSVARSLASNRN